MVTCGDQMMEPETMGLAQKMELVMDRAGLLGTVMVLDRKEAEENN